VICLAGSGGPGARVRQAIPLIMQALGFAFAREAYVEWQDRLASRQRPPVEPISSPRSSFLYIEGEQTHSAWKELPPASPGTAT